LQSLSKRSRTLLVAAMACAPGIAIFSFAQQAPVLYPVSGVVLNTLTRQPIPRVLVDANTNAALTDGDGRFELDLPEGVDQIQVRRPGYRSRGQDMAHGVNVGANMSDLTFYLTPQATITGHVALSSGDDADGIRFTVYLRHTVNGHQKWRTAGTAVTNSEGVFRAANLETPGVYAFCSMLVEDRNNVRAIGTRKTGSRTLDTTAGIAGYPSTCYPGPISESADAANMLAISPGQQPEFELALNRQPFYQVSIAVPNAPPGQPVDVQIYDPDGRALEYSAAWNAQLGVALVDLPNGSYYAEAHSRGERLDYARADFHVANGPVSGLSMTLLPLRPIPVEVRREFTVNAGNNPLQSQIAASPGVNLVLTSADSGIGDSVGTGLNHREGTTDKSLFELDDVAPGRYWVQATPYQGYLSSMTSGGADLTREPLIVGPGNTTASIQIALRNDGGQIQCTVNPAASSATAPPLGEMSFYFVYAIPEFPAGAQIPQTASQGLGACALANLAPGRYRVVALDKSMEIDGSDPGILERFSGLGKPVTVEAGGVVNLELDLIRTGAAETQEGTTP